VYVCGVYGVRTTASYDSKILHIWHDGCNGCRPPVRPFSPSGQPRATHPKPPYLVIPLTDPALPRHFVFFGVVRTTLYPSKHPCSIADWNLTTAMTAQVHHLQICPMLVRSNSAPRLRSLLLTILYTPLPTLTLLNDPPLIHTPPSLRALIPSNHSSFHPLQAPPRA
jgi:hypothetical protein